MIHSYMPDEIWKMKIPLAAKVIAARICALTKNGEKECFVSNEYLSNQFSMSKKTVQSSLNTLEASKIIVTKITKRNDKKIRLVYFIYQDIDSQVCKNSESESVKNTLSESVVFSNEKCNFFQSESVKNTLSSIQNKDLLIRRESNDPKTPHSPSSFDNVFSKETIEKILSSTASEMNVSLGKEKLQIESAKFFDYYSDKNLSSGQIKVKARTWIENCCKYPDYKNKKQHKTTDGGMFEVLKEECGKEPETTGREIVFPDFSESENNGYPVLLEYPNDLK